MRSPVSWNIGVVRAQLDENWSASLSGLYLGGLEVRAGGPTIGYKITPDFLALAGYSVASLDRGGFPSDPIHTLRAGLFWRQHLGDFTVDDQLYVEEQLRRGASPVGQVRNRVRLTYDLPMLEALKPRVVVGVEPFVDTRRGGLSRTRFSAGIGATVAGTLIDLYWLRQDAAGGRLNDLNAVVLQAVVLIGK